MSDNLQSLIKLLIIEDDPKIIEHVSNELVKKGHSIIDTLQTVADTHNQVAVSDIIEDIIHRIHCRQLHTDLKHWATFRDDDLLEGLLLVASFQYPFLEVSIVKERLAELQRCATDDVLPTCATTKAISILSNNIYGAL
jgi:flagellar biosynthesis component FlhA